MKFMCGLCRVDMSGPKYRSDGFKFFHCYECPSCKSTLDVEQSHEAFLDNERAMRGLDARDCDAINAAISDPGDFNYGRGR